MKSWLRIDRLLAGLLPLVLPVVPGGGTAAQPAASGIVAAETAASGAVWTPQRLLNAQPADPAPSAGFAAAPAAAAPAASAERQGGAGHPPTVWVPPLPDDLVNAPVDLGSAKAIGGIENAARGGGVFTESRVIPPNTGQTAPAVNAYPYSAVGKLFFHDKRTGQDFRCSAAVDSLRMILTAGHCVAHGSPVSGQRYFFTDFKFIPAYDNGEAPYGQWSTTGYHLVSNAWWFSGRVPNPGDFALLEAADQGGKTLGAVVGYLGWQTQRLRFNEFTTLGYPGNLDSGMLMQRNDAPTSGFGGSNTWLEGSNMGAGAGGGPWVQDFGLNPKGAPGVPFGGNTVVGVTSYTPTSGIGFLGASQFDQVFINMRKAFCAHHSGNC